VKFEKLKWIASYPKSGNTWARNLINAYASNELDINNVRIGLNDTSVGAYQASTLNPINTLDAGIIACLRYAALVNLQSIMNYSPKIIKTHNARVQVDGIDLIPDMMSDDSVYIVRDPRDVVISFSEHMGLSIDDAIDMMDNSLSCLPHRETHIETYLTTWSNHVTTWRDKATLLRYEDMLEDPVDALSTILKVFRLDIDENRVQRAVDLCSFERMKSQEEKNGFREASFKSKRFFNRGTSGHWKEILKKDQVDKIEKAHGEVMESLGYFEEERKRIWL